MRVHLNVLVHARELRALEILLNDSEPLSKRAVETHLPPGFFEAESPT